MNILVVGNGFDLAHGLPTRYGDFLDFVRAFQRFQTVSEREDTQYYKYFLALKEEKADIFQELDFLITQNRWLGYFIRIYKSRQDEGKGGWIDFESEISAIIQALDAARHTLNEQFRTGVETAHMEQWQFITLKPIFFTDSHVNEFDSTVIGYKKSHALNDLNRLTRCLEIYLSDYISNKTCDPLKDIGELYIDKVLSFNYTDTYKLIYDKSISEIKYDFIHGKADIEKDVKTCNLVLGIDEYLSGDSKNLDNEFIHFKKFFQRIYKMTGCKYVDWIKCRNETIQRMPKLPPPEMNVYIYGHSLDVTDADILRRLILEEGAKTTIFYHSQEALGDQIANLVKVIGEDELIKRTDGNHRSIIFRQSSPETI